MLGAAVKVGAGKYPRLIARSDHFVAGWVDLFGKVILQRLDLTGKAIGAPTPLMINGFIRDFDIASYAGGVAVGWSREEGQPNGYVSYVRSFDDTLTPLALEQRLGNFVATATSEIVLRLEGVGGGSNSFAALELKKEGVKNVVRISFLPQGVPGKPVPMTVWLPDVTYMFPDILPRLFSTDYGVVGILKIGQFTPPALRGWGPAGNFVWDGSAPQDGRISVAEYSGDNIVVVNGYMPSDYRIQQLSATDGTEVSKGPNAFGLLGGQAKNRPLDSIWYNDSLQFYACMDPNFAYGRFMKDGTFVPFDALQPTMGACNFDTQLRLAGAGGTVGVLYSVGTDLYFRPQLCP
jgi:hypothetical protein